MKKIYTLILLATIVVTTLSLTQTERKVFICNTKNAVAYHYIKNCHGLQKCKGTISEVSVETAKGKGLHLCGFED